MKLIYSVTVSIESEVAAEWLAWMQQEHVPQVLATGCFDSCLTHHLLEPREQGHETYNFQYLCRTPADYQRYREQFSPALQAETQLRYGGRFTAFRTLLERL